MELIGGRFELLAPAGAGGMSQVFRARDRQTGAIVAVKILKHDGKFDVARFEREAQMLAAIQHPHVVDYVAHGCAGGVHFLAQEWVEGTTLRRRLDDTGLTAREAVAICTGIARALAAAHAAGIIHRDIKPSNIMLVAGDADRVKLVDFGVSRTTGCGPVLTQTGVVVGTPSYMAPEQARAAKIITPAVDSWALGCVLYEALAGRRAFTGRTAFAARSKVLLRDPPPLETVCPEAPPELAMLVATLLAKPPEARPPDGSDILARMLALPAVGDGPRRRVGGTANGAPTVSLAAAAAVPNAVVMYGIGGGRSELPPDHFARLGDVAARHQLELHAFEDGSALLAAFDGGALSAALAAIDLQRDLNGAVTLVGSPQAADLDAALDRGAVQHERATMSALFGDVVGEPTDLIPIDEALAAELTQQLPVIRTEHGPALSARRT